MLKNEIQELKYDTTELKKEIQELKSDMTELKNENREQNSRIDALVTQYQFLFGNAVVVQKFHMRVFISLMREKITQVLNKFPEGNNWNRFLSDVLSSPEDLGKLGLTQEAVETIRDYNRENKLNETAHSATWEEIALAITAMKESAEKELFKTVLYPMLFDGLDVDEVVFSVLKSGL